MKIIGKVKEFLGKLFPPEIRAYIPGAKIIAGGIVYVVCSVLGLAQETVVHLPGLDFNLNVPEFAAFVGAYFWPTSVREADKTREQRIQDERRISR